MANYPYSGGKKTPFTKKYQTNKLRCNERIRVHEVRVIGPEGKQLGVMLAREALKLAKEVGLDLVEISPTARPPVCRIIDYGKYMYEESKKSKSTKKSTATKLKEIKFRVNIEQHDYITKIRRAEAFLAKGFKLKITLFFRGREMEQKNRGFDIVKRAVGDLEQVGAPDYPSKMVGRNISITLSPLPERKRKLKFNTQQEVEEAKDEPEDDEAHESLNTE